MAASFRGENFNSQKFLTFFAVCRAYNLQKTEDFCYVSDMDPEIQVCSRCHFVFIPQTWGFKPGVEVCLFTFITHVLIPEHFTCLVLKLFQLFADFAEG